MAHQRPPIVIAFLLGLTALPGCGEEEPSQDLKQDRPSATQNAQLDGRAIYEANYRNADLELECGMREVDGPSRIGFTDDGDVIHRDPQGRELWQVHLGSKLGSVRPPARLLRDGRVIFVRYPGMVALDATDGAELWRTHEPADRLLAKGDLVLSTHCSYEDPKKRWLVARQTSDGEVVWREAIPKHQDPGPLQGVGDCVLVRSGIIEHGHSQLVDSEGYTVLALPDECVYSGMPVGDAGELILLTSRRALRFRRSDQEITWQTDLPDESFWPFMHSDSIWLHSGDLLVYRFSPIADSGVEVYRVDPEKGEVRWEAHCEPLGVMHSEYRHRVYVHERAGELVIVSKGARYFVEVLDRGTGAQLKRFEFDTDRDGR